MTTYNKKTVIIWNKNNYLINTVEVSVPTNAEAMAEFNAKQDQMITLGKMDPDSMKVQIRDSELISIRKFLDAESAQEWVDFNNDFATKYNYIKISSAIIGN
jgi:hypothetical protein